MNLLRSLSIVLVKRYKSKQWNQTNYYSLNYERLFEFLKWKTAVTELCRSAETIETTEMCVSTAQDEGYSTLELRHSDLSLKDTKTTSSDLTTKLNKKSITRNGNCILRSWTLWQSGDRLMKKSRYIPKRLLARVQKMKAEKAPVREILEILGKR